MEARFDMHRELLRLPVVPDEIEAILYPGRDFGVKEVVAVDVAVEADKAEIEAM